MRYLKQSTSHTLRIGPFIDDTDGKTAETGLTISNTDVRLSKNDGNFVSKNSGGGTHDEIGWYSITLNATDTDTVGPMVLAVHKSGALPVWHEFMVVPANVYNAMVGSDKLQVDAVEVSGSTTAADNVEANIGNLDATVSSRSDFDETTDAVTLADGPHGGTAAVLTLERLIAEATTTNEPAVKLTGHGTATGLRLQGGATGAALLAISAGGSGKAAAQFVGDGAGAGIQAAGGATGDGIKATAGATSGSGISATSSVSGSGIKASGATYDIEGDLQGSVSGSVGSLGAQAKVDVDAEVDEAIENYGLDHLLAAAVTGTDVVDNSIIAKLVSSAATADWDTFVNTDDSLQAISESGGGGPTAEQIADQVWDEAKSGHVAAGSFGEEVQAHALSSEISALNNPSAAAIADAVWDELVADHTTAGTTGEAIDDPPRNAVFITDCGNAGDGTITNQTYLSPDTEPSNKVMTGAESDDDTITITAEIHCMGKDWQPTSVDLYRDDSPLSLTINRADWTQLDDRVFQVQFTVSDATADATYHVQTSDGKKSGDFAYVRGLDPPEILTAAWNGTYPDCDDSPAYLDTGTQTAVKDGDVVTVTGTVETHATRITVVEYGATAGHGSDQHFDDDYSSGNFSIQVTIGSGSGSKQFRLKANKDGGAYGSTLDTTDSPAISLDQDGPSFGSYTTDGFTPADNWALASGDSCNANCTISNWSAGNDLIKYTSTEVTITADTTYAASKTATYASGSYRDSGTNVTIEARRKANGKYGSKTGLVKIANVAPVLTMSGATSRLRSSAAGDQNYALTLSADQELKDTPTCTRDAGDDGDALGAWSGSEPDKTWTNILVVGEEDTKNTGASSYSWAGVSAHNGAGIEVTAITNNPDYTIGGFAERDVAVSKFDEWGPIGTTVSNKDNSNKLVMEYVGIGSGTYVENTIDDPGSRKFTICDASGNFDADGAYIRCLDSNIYDAVDYTMRIEETA